MATAQTACLRIARGAVVLNQGPRRGGCRTFHYRCIETREMVRRQTPCIVAISTTFSAVRPVLPRIIAVVLRCPRGMARRALRVHVDCARVPRRRCLAAMTADILADTTTGGGGSTALRVIRSCERHIDRGPGIGVIDGVRSTVPVAGVAAAGHARKGIVFGMAAGTVRRDGTVWHTAVA